MDESTLIAALISGLISLAGGYILYRSVVDPKRESAEQKISRLKQEKQNSDNELIGWYRNLLEDIQKQYDEQEQRCEALTKTLKEEREAHEIEVGNFRAIILKRELEYKEDLKVLKNKLQAYQVTDAEIRRLARRHMPNVALPEVGISTQDL
jgi:peptidoglycan hydrolase CwlO-like protein